MTLFVLVALAVSLAANTTAIASLLRIHPRRRRLTITAAILGNAMWPFFPLLNARTPFSRAVRATLGPPWFAWLSFAILYSAFIAAVALIGTLVRRGDFASFARRPSRAFLWLTVVASVAGFYDAVVPLRIERVPISIAGLPAQAEGMRIAVLADLHVGLFTRVSRLQQFFRAAAASRPDAVVIAGDLIDDDPWFVPKLVRGTSAVDPSIPLLAVLGNHEMYGAPWEAIAQIRRTRIRLLVNEGMTLRGIWIAGLSDFAARDERLRPNLQAALAGRPAGMLPIVIAHQPKAFDPARAEGIPLTLVAHTHGGQCGFRPLHWSLAGLFLPYHMGLYRVGSSQLYVNTGTGYWLVPFRLGMTPEITVVELHRGGG